MFEYPLSLLHGACMCMYVYVFVCACVCSSRIEAQLLVCCWLALLLCYGRLMRISVVPGSPGVLKMVDPHSRATQVKVAYFRTPASEWRSVKGPSS